MGYAIENLVVNFFNLVTHFKDGSGYKYVYDSNTMEMHFFFIKASQ